MGGAGEHEDEYGAQFVAALEWMWGEGFLSPGGAEEVALLLEDVPIAGAEVLDIGCGLGAIDVLLASRHQAARVIGIDIEAPLVERAREAVAGAGLSDRVEIRLVEPGPLRFADATFDLVFSKDAIIHIPDKAAFYAEVRRVLRPGGWFVGSDWLRGGEGPYPARLAEWLDVVGLSFEMKNASACAAAIEQAGFVDVTMRDRNAWYAGQVREEIASCSGVNQAKLAARVGEEAARHRLHSSTMKLEVVEMGELRPTHFRARKPA